MISTYRMKIVVIAIVGAAATVSGPVYADNVAWHLDDAHTHIGFVVRHLGLAKVRGEFKKFSAQISADEKTGKIAEVVATADAKSIDTGIGKRDDHLRSDDFFNAAKFPTVKLKTKHIKWSGNSLTAVVDLTLRDVTKPVTFTGEYAGVRKVNFGTGDQLRSAYTLSAKINRQEFNLKFNKLAEGVSVVSDEVTIEFEAEISRSL